MKYRKFYCKEKTVLVSNILDVSYNNCFIINNDNFRRVLIKKNVIILSNDIETIKRVNFPLLFVLNN